MAARASSNQGVDATVLDNTRISIKNDATTRVSKLASREQIHLKKRDMTNIRNRKRRSRKGAPTRNRKRGSINQENTDMRRETTESGQKKKTQRSYERKLQNPNTTG